MLQNDKFDSLHKLLYEMTQENKADHHTLPPRLRQLERMFTLGFIVSVFLFAIVAFFDRLTSETINHSMTSLLMLMLILYFAMLIFGVLHMLTHVVLAFRTTRRQGKGRFNAILASLEHDLSVDASFLKRLWEFDKETLQYALLQYQHRWRVFDGRMAMFSGDLRKLGLLPAFVAASISATTLLKEDANMFLWMPLILACGFYAISFCAMASRERPEQVIALLEYAVQHADSPVQNTLPTPAPS